MIYIYRYIFIHDIYIYIYTLWNHQFDFQTCATPKKKECVCSPTLQWWAAPQCSAEWGLQETTSTNDAGRILWILWFFGASLPSSMVSSLPTFLHLYGLSMFIMLSVKTTSSHNLVSMKIRFLSPITVLLTPIWPPVLQFATQGMTLYQLKVFITPFMECIIL